MHKLWTLPVSILLSFSMQTAATFAADAPPGLGNCNHETPIEDGACEPQANTGGTEILKCMRTSVLPTNKGVELCAKSCELWFHVGDKKPRIANIRAFGLVIHSASGHQFTEMKFNTLKTSDLQQITFGVQRLKSDPGQSPCTGHEEVSVTYTLELEMERK